MQNKVEVEVKVEVHSYKRKQVENSSSASCEHARVDIKRTKTLHDCHKNYRRFKFSMRVKELTRAHDIQWSNKSAHVCLADSGTSLIRTGRDPFGQHQQSDFWVKPEDEPPLVTEVAVSAHVQKPLLNLDSWAQSNRNQDFLSVWSRLAENARALAKTMLADPPSSLIHSFTPNWSSKPSSLLATHQGSKILLRTNSLETSFDENLSKLKLGLRARDNANILVERITCEVKSSEIK